MKRIVSLLAAPADIPATGIKLGKERWIVRERIPAAERLNRAH